MVQNLGSAKVEVYASLCRYLDRNSLPVKLRMEMEDLYVETICGNKKL